MNYIDEDNVPQKQNRILSGKYVMTPILLTGITVIAWGYYSYKSFAKAAADATHKKIKKIPSTKTSMSLLDWREIEVEDLSQSEMDRVHTYALSQAVFDTLIACVVLTSLMFLLSTLNKIDEAQMKASILNKEMPALFFAVLTCAAALYSLVYTYNIKQELPFYMKWWYGNEYTWFAPLNMIGTMFTVASVFVLIYLTKTQFPDINLLYKQANQQSTATEKATFYLIVMIGIYIIYSFYGAYLTTMVKRSDYFEPYLNYLYPFVVSCAIALLTTKITGNYDSGFITLLACCALIAFRSFGQNTNAENLFSDMDFWTDLFFWVLGVLVFFTLVSYKQGTLNTSPASIFIAALTGVFLFFSLQLFWTTTLVLGNAIVASMSALILLLIANDIGTYTSDVKMALISGCLMTGTLWMNMYSQYSFQTFVK